ncbi:CPBP family intramembrane metalloprotease [Nocardia uniformis]|uniref:CPBP family intramembrane metalloprotease n=1 Tax=Nocardia uniformis TaxID=53432 RepID=A0A849CHT4_9NOCA|nr:type II CAAX endopeptidase family protein [Nocardia uniformis]NNH75609.1 CPBP family intramembrane metalloprotease [Nocardia uniformis]
MNRDIRAWSKTAVAIALPLLWSNRVLPGLNLDMRGRTAANVAFASAYAFTFGGRPNWLSPRGRRVGITAAAVVTSGYAAALAIPGIRQRLVAVPDRAPEVTDLEWVSLHIPLGTVYSEEMIFRATLSPILDGTAGRFGKWLSAATFGLWHIYPARAAGDSVPGAVAATAAAGLLFDELGRRTGSTTAPALLHLAVNAGGALVRPLARLLSGSDPHEGDLVVRAPR